MSDGGAVELDLSALRAFARRLGRAAAESGVFVALHGPLGAGKTTLVQAACAALGVDEDVLSPTFTLVHRYRGAAADVLHVDLYRIESSEELPGLGWDDLVAAEVPVFVEWAERAGPELPRDRWEVRLAPGRRPELRRVSVRALGAAPEPPRPDRPARSPGASSTEGRG